MSAAVAIDTGLQVRALSVLLSRYNYRYQSEAQLHQALAAVLSSNGYAFEHEHVLDKQSRADFLLDSGIVIEVKVDDSLANALRQVARYSQLDQVKGILLASTAAWAAHPFGAIAVTNGKPFEVVHLQRRFL